MIFFEEKSVDLQIDVIQKCIHFLHSSDCPDIGSAAEVGDGIRCIVSQYDTKDEVEISWEAHREFVDVHCVLAGEEKVRISYTSQCEAGVYCSEKDYLPVEGEAIVEVRLEAGTVLCLFPNDAHQVKLWVHPNQPCKVKKAVFKVPVVLFE
jgi:YhcH/YjgK/YiaL family protein